MHWFRRLAVLWLLYQIAGTAAGQPVDSARVLVTLAGARTSAAVEPGDLIATVDGKNTDVADVSVATAQPLVFAVLADASGSDRAMSDFVEKASLSIYQTLATGENQGYFADFNDEVYFATNKKPASIQDIKQEFGHMIPFRGGTALYDAVVATATLVRRAAGDSSLPTALFVISDGDDNASRMSLDRALDEELKTAVPIYFIELPNAPSKRARNTARQLSLESGGADFFSAGNVQSVSTFVAATRQHQYWLTMPIPALQKRKMHSLHVTSTRSDLQVSAPPSFPSR